jgi:hypothetical protein
LKNGQIAAAWALWLNEVIKVCSKGMNPRKLTVAKEDKLEFPKLITEKEGKMMLN